MATPYNLMASGLGSGRSFGGTSESVTANPYVSGYMFTYWQLPASLSGGYIDFGSSDYAKLASPIKGNNEAARILSGTCLSFTPPNQSINKVELTGLGGTKWTVPSNIEYDTQFSAKFLELSGTPILRIIDGWQRMIRDNSTGISKLKGTQYAKSQYAGSVLYWTTKPDGLSVEVARSYTGVWPTTNPISVYNGDLATIDKVEVDQTFASDTPVTADWVTQLCQAKAQQYHDAFIAAKQAPAERALFT